MSTARLPGSRASSCRTITASRATSRVASPPAPPPASASSSVSASCFVLDSSASHASWASPELRLTQRRAARHGTIIISRISRGDLRLDVRRDLRPHLRGDLRLDGHQRLVGRLAYAGHARRVDLSVGEAGGRHLVRGWARVRDLGFGVRVRVQVRVRVRRGVHRLRLHARGVARVQRLDRLALERLPVEEAQKALVLRGDQAHVIAPQLAPGLPVCPERLQPELVEQPRAGRQPGG
eukprot:scaffold58954_cov53-Phaeocystis_antarctica.AAC.4